ncbi:MAG: copper chaperone PCu(A)C [Betaproteobacteria bacterium]
MRWWVAACGLALALSSLPARAVVIINQPWLRPAQPGQSAELYMNLTSSDAATVVAIQSNDASKVLFRGPDKIPRALDNLVLPARVMVVLAPGKAHFALIKLNRPVRLGDRINLILTIQSANGTRQEIPMQAEVRIRSAVEEEMRGHAH